jgi:hypothetical protein
MTRDEFISELSKTADFEWVIREDGRKIRAKIALPKSQPHCPDFPDLDANGYYYACPISAVASLRVPNVAWGYLDAGRFLGLKITDMDDIANAADCKWRELEPLRKKILAATGL